MDFGDFVSFWWDCISAGAKAFHGMVGIGQTITFIGVFYLWWHKYNPTARPINFRFKPGEIVAMRLLAIIAAAILVGYSLLYVPSEKFRDEKKAKEKFETALNNKAAKLDGFIDQSIYWTEPGTTNTMVILQISVNNSGDSASIAERFKLELTLTNSASVSAMPIDITDQYSWSVLKSNSLIIYKLKRPDLISEKTSIAIQPGYAPRGWLAFRLKGVSLNNKSITNGSMVVSFLDVSGEQIFVTNGFWKGKVSTNIETAEIPRTLPGSVNLVDTNIQLINEFDVANWKPPELEPGCTNINIAIGNLSFSFSRWQAIIPPDDSAAEIPLSSLPESFATDLEKTPNYSPRLNRIWIKHGFIQMSFGNKLVDLPFCPFIVSNRLFLYVKIPFMEGMQKLVMNDKFDPVLPLLWDRNYSTNQYVYEIVNENKKPIMQVFYIAPNEIRINGIFIVNSNSVLEAFGDAPRLMTLGYKAIDLETKQESTNISFNRLIASSTQTNSFGTIMTNTLYDLIFTNQRAIFKYPSGRNVGVFDN